MNGILFEKQAKLTEQRSKFFAQTFFCSSQNQMQSILAEVKRAHPSCSHVCFACVAFDREIKTFFSDDKEPSGTAGVQILNALKQNEIVNALCVVVRYFGGTKLGVPGLSKAYHDVATMCFENNLKQLQIKSLCKIVCSYVQADRLKKIAKQNDVELFDGQFFVDASFCAWLTTSQQTLLKSVDCKIIKLGKEKYR